MSKYTLSSLNILNNKFKNKTRDFWKKLRNLWYIFFPTPKNSFLPFQIWRYIIAYTWICYISGGLTVNGLPSKNTMMIFLVSTIAYTECAAEENSYLFIFSYFSLLFVSLLHMTKAIFCPLWSLLIYCCLFPPLCDALKDSRERFTC
jgi:CDP-diglyceride synthetase